MRVRQQLLEKARRRDALWREPFLLALAYKNSEPSGEAQELIRALLAGSPADARKQRAHDILLAGQCLIEAKSSAILMRSELLRSLVTFFTAQALLIREIF